MAERRYFYTAPESIDSGLSILYLTDDEARHCLQVLRMKSGDRCYVVNGQGDEYETEIIETVRDRVVCKILNHRMRPNELKVEITLALALIKKDRFEWALEKATELGVHAVIPLKTGRSVVEPGFQKIRRWEKTLIAAMKQSERSMVPVLRPVTDFHVLLAEAGNYDMALIAHEQSARPMISFAGERLKTGTVRSLLIGIGPEGGFTDEEIQSARRHHLTDVSLGPTRLRSETAAIAAVAVIAGQLHPWVP